MRHSPHLSGDHSEYKRRLIKLDLLRRSGEFS